MDETDKLLVYVYIGAGWIIGCIVFGILAIQRNEECRISKFYLCQVKDLKTVCKLYFEKHIFAAFMIYGLTLS